LVNIYIDYFRVLLMLKETIVNYSQDRLQLVKDEVEKIKSKINQKTISVFPDSEKLIYFLDIISLFNEKNEDKCRKLYGYIDKYSLDRNKAPLKTLAKITLSNNLMVSETDDSTEFSLKNLKHISSYLENGVLSLKENEPERLQRELNEKIKYWRDIILQDESDTIEFKATFLTPIPDEKRIKELVYLKNAKTTEEIRRKIDRIEGETAIKIVMHSALKTLGAFANSSGGTLLLGVTDDKRIIGLEKDYMSLTQKDRDGFGKRFDDAIKTYFGEGFSTLLHRQFLNFPEGEVFIVTVDPSPEEVFIYRDEEGRTTEDLYIRQHSSSEPLKGIELAKFIKVKFSKQLKNTLKS
jgi:hypothetical protein